MECTNAGGCTLNADELVERVGAWREVSSRALSREVHADGVRSVYPSEPALVQTLRRLIAAEAGCCSFLEFSVSEGPTETVVELGFPPHARALVEQVMGAGA
ncbi:MAG TPA: hypothetical protein VHI71_10160 [Actinomycetota bacterium]|nr:hypothetical protein [Actinomycetota bacterium]